MKKSICHKDGTVSFWSKSTNKYKTRVFYMSEVEQIGVGQNEASRLMAHLEKHNAKDPFTLLLEKIDGNESHT